MIESSKVPSTATLKLDGCLHVSKLILVNPHVFSAFQRLSTWTVGGSICPMGCLRNAPPALHFADLLAGARKAEARCLTLGRGKQCELHFPHFQGFLGASS